MTGRKGDRSVKAPELPQLAGYTAAWPAFTPTGRDMTITAVYRQNLVSGGRVTKSGTYFIPWLASGEITIAGGLDVTLIGLDSGTDRFDNLTLTVGSGTKLTLQDVRITGDRTLLSLAGKNTLTLLGRNELHRLRRRVRQRLPDRRLRRRSDHQRHRQPPAAGAGQQRGLPGRGKEQNLYRGLYPHAAEVRQARL